MSRVSHLNCVETKNKTIESRQLVSGVAEYHNKRGRKGIIEVLIVPRLSQTARVRPLQQSFIAKEKFEAAA